MVGVWCRNDDHASMHDGGTRTRLRASSPSTGRTPARCTSSRTNSRNRRRQVDERVTLTDGQSRKIAAPAELRSQYQGQVLHVRTPRRQLISVVGAETCPGIYLFHLALPAGSITTTTSTSRTRTNGTSSVRCQPRTGSRGSTHGPSRTGEVSASSRRPSRAFPMMSRRVQVGSSEALSMRGIAVAA